MNKEDRMIELLEQINENTKLVRQWYQLQFIALFLGVIVGGFMIIHSLGL